MPTAETTPRSLFRPVPPQAERSEKSERPLGRQIFTGRWLSQRMWVRRLMTPPLTAEKDADVAAVSVTTISPEEITLAKVSRTPGRVIVPLTDEQAEQIKRITQED